MCQCQVIYGLIVSFAYVILLQFIPYGIYEIFPVLYACVAVCELTAETAGCITL